jgi:hypothetical protein
VRWEGFGFLCAAAIFSQNCHFGVPSIVALMEDKRHAKFVFMAGRAKSFSCISTCAHPANS